jgi:lipopolysaccharide/colanic/teichoic acid biosynthesis glycosyltransferase
MVEVLQGRESWSRGVVVRRGKRLFDVLGASLGLVVASPLLAIFCALVWRLHGRPVLYVQYRPGLGAKIFRMYKFRTMTDERDEFGRLLPDDQRLTRLGRFLRGSSLDELPELFNVLKGDMSLVGPRPLLVEYLPLYNLEQARRHGVKPGVTGWAQINGRNAISWEEKFELDLWYVDNWSLWVDVKILCLTLLKVLKRSGVSAAEHATMPKFTGSDNTTDDTLPR